VGGAVILSVGSLVGFVWANRSTSPEVPVET
jgi:hypothetical protein